MAKSTKAKTESTQKRPNAARAAPATRSKSAKPKAAKAAPPAKGKGEKKPAPAIAPGEKGPRKVAKPVKDQGDKIAEPRKAARAKPQKTSSEHRPLNMRELLEAKQRRVRQGPAWPDANPHNHRVQETLDESPGQQASEKAAAAEAKNMDPTERDRRSKHEARGVR